MNSQRLLDRFLRYVAVDTMSDESADCYPSSSGQRQLGQMLLHELHAMGITKARQDEHGLVWATLDASPPMSAAPVVAFNAHLDTSPETSGANVRPQVLRDYPGGDLTLPGNPAHIIRVQDNPELEQLLGCTLVTTDGTTLLGGDDKAGVAIMMELAASLVERPEVPHGPLRLLFTCDEEIGRGVRYVDLADLGAHVCYTLDGPAAGNIDVETFSADLAVVTIAGINIHPSIAKNRMVNAVRVAAELVSRLPRDRLSPETTEHREGFLHPYHVQGGVEQVALRILLRDFQTAALEQQADLLREVARRVQEDFVGATIDVQLRPQYRNLAQGLRREPRAVAYAQLAHERLGRQARLTLIRGGTDGCLLTEKGLPTPNLSCGQHNPHSPLEWVCLEEMVQALQVVLELVQVWAERPPLSAAPRLDE